jgi:hypothetical protein
MAALPNSHPPSPSGSPSEILLLRETEKEPAIGIENVIDITNANVNENGIPVQSQHPSLHASLVRLAMPNPNPAPTSPHASIG